MPQSIQTSVDRTVSTFRVDFATFYCTGPGHMNRAHPTREFPSRFICPQSPVSAPLLTRRSDSLRSGSVGRKQSAL